MAARIFPGNTEMQSITKANNVTTPTHLKVMLTWYRLDDRQLAGEEVIHTLTEQNVLDLFNAPFWNHAYLCNALENKQHFKSIQKNISHILEPDKYSYFLEMFKIEEQLSQSQHS